MATPRKPAYVPADGRAVLTESMSMRRQLGFTLLELLLAISILSVLTLLAWRTLDTLSKSETWTQERTQHWQGWRIALAQWQADLDALEDLAPEPAPVFDGLVIQWVRRAAPLPEDDTPGWQVVAWGLQPDAQGAPHLARWASPVLRERQALLQAWQAARLWARNPSDALRAQQTLLPAVQEWQLLYYRGGAWSNPQSSSGGGTETETTAPSGIRLLLTLPGEGAPETRQLLMDWVHPSFNRPRTDTGTP
ncbi:general secretion pathway protein GspJ [Hylemonella gracilis str. Niagara R]|uniref:General secretion pathway protein GspJ n=1 Tax=Hylemonella gracilis str. Niagara R TaxID=1458275 RepID=A0A016XGX9_9BURK|nr:prepilin-type N-terminal cleavage/methylation domain-containing protein [Hylemonella gracilis]EYC51066.1 general secretion pathway protein GspJ [Hylemonella gracilis str. Niagara R]